MKVKILRQLSPGQEPYWERFDADVPGETSIAGLLDHLNYHDDIVDETGRKTTRIGWECSCLQGICGSCAMVINGVPALACETLVRELKGNEITIRPLQKYPVIHDLVVDRSVIHENLKQANIYIGEYQPEPEWSDAKKRQAQLNQYTAAKCLKCGLCLEVCPNYVNGKHFFGAIFANDCYLVSTRNRSKSYEIKKLYGEHFASGCSKALSCMDVCPMHIQTIASMAKLNSI